MGCCRRLAFVIARGDGLFFKPESKMKLPTVPDLTPADVRAAVFRLFPNVMPPDPHAKLVAKMLRLSEPRYEADLRKLMKANRP